MTNRLFDATLGFIIGLLLLTVAIFRHEVIETVVLTEGGNTPSSFFVDCPADAAGEIRCRVRRPDLEQAAP